MKIPGISGHSLCTPPWQSIHPFPMRADIVPSETRSELQCTPAGCQVHPPVGTLQRCFQSLCTNAFLLMIQYQSKTAQKFIPWLPELWHPCQNSATGELLPTQTHQTQWWSPSQSFWLNNGKNKRSYRMWNWTTTWAVVSKIPGMKNSFLLIASSDNTNFLQLTTEKTEVCMYVIW